MLQGSLFSEKEMHKMASPERLDTMVTVTKPLGWLALLVFCLIVLGFLVWSIFGKLRITVQGQGILVKDQLVEIQAGTEGSVVALLVNPGDSVKKDQVVARLKPTTLLNEKALNVDMLQERQKLHAQATPLERKEFSSKTQQLKSEQQRLPQQLESAKQVAETQKNAVERSRENLQRGFIVQGQFNQALSSLDQANRAVSDLETRKGQVEAEIAQAESQLTKAEKDRLLEIADLQNKIVQLDRQIATGGEVRSLHQGVIVEVKVDRDKLVDAKTVLLSMEPEEGVMLAVIYVKAEDAKKIMVDQTGQPVAPVGSQISPSTVKSEEYGFMLGQVRTVAAFPATPEGMLRQLKNQGLVEKLTEDGPPIEVRTELFRDGNAVSGFRWSSQGGPAVGIASGTMCNGTFEVERKRPISYVIPAVKKAIGLN
jgi:HlyD family secretion protein